MINENIHKDFTLDLNWWQKAIYYFLWSIIYLTSLWPLKVMYVFSDGLYLFVYKLFGYRKKLVRKNLKDSFPEKSEAERLVIEKKFYHFFCDYVFETIKLASMTKDEMRKRVKYTGLEHLNRYLEGGHNIALYLGHYCNWEWVTSIGLYVPDNVFGGQVYHILENKTFNALMLKLRSGMGPESISMQVVLRKIIENRKAGNPIILGFISDQVPLYQATHYWTDFLNHKDTIVITGTERIAKQCDFSCVYLDISRPKRGYYDINIIPLAENPNDYPDWEITEMYFRHFEESIRRAPEYWLWTHNRWKRDLKGFKEWQEEEKNNQ